MEKSAAAEEHRMAVVPGRLHGGQSRGRRPIAALNAGTILLALPSRPIAAGESIFVCVCAYGVHVVLAALARMWDCRMCGACL